MYQFVILVKNQPVDKKEVKNIATRIKNNVKARKIGLL